MIANLSYSAFKSVVSGGNKVLYVVDESDKVTMAAAAGDPACLGSSVIVWVLTDPPSESTFTTDFTNSPVKVSSLFN